MSTAPSSNKYFIKSLEEEIGLFDRKLAHLHKFESFPSDAERDAAAAKLSAKRDRLIRTVRDLTEGVPAPSPAKPAKAAVKSKTSKRSKASAKSVSLAEAPAATPELVPQIPEMATASSETSAPSEISAPPGISAPSRIASPYAGTSLDSDKELASYLQDRAKNHRPA